MDCVTGSDCRNQNIGLIRDTSTVGKVFNVLERFEVIRGDILFPLIYIYSTTQLLLIYCIIYILDELKHRL